MQIEKNKVVTFHYALSAHRPSAEGLSAEGGYSESSRGGQPAVYLHGYGGIVRGLEREMRGRSAGESFSVEVSPEDGFGPRNEEIVQRIPLKRLSGSAAKLSRGSVVNVRTRQGNAQGVVQKVGRFNVDVDFNHPMAGCRLTFEVEILDVRDASAEEISHRHVHGPGGVQHGPAGSAPQPEA